jgi:dienelactone hydrolase
MCLPCCERSSSPCSRPAGTASAATLDESAPPGNNYDKAEFRFWYPDSAGPLRALVVLVPGLERRRPAASRRRSSGGRFATRLNLGLVGCRFTDKQHEQMFIEHYVNVSKGTGQALLDALASFARRSGHAEVADAPLLLWGMSAGGEFNYEFAAWKPERVVAFVVNKGNVYYTDWRPTPRGACPACCSRAKQISGTGSRQSTDCSASTGAPARCGR